MVKKCVWFSLAILLMVSGCAKTKSAKKASTGKPSAEAGKQDTIQPFEEPSKYDNKKYSDKLDLAKDGISFAHKFDCPGAYRNQIKDRKEGPDGRLVSYTQIVQCSVTGETHDLRYYDMLYNETAQKKSYKMELSCSKTGEHYRLTVDEIGYDFYWEILTYKVFINGDTLIFPKPKKKKKKK